MMAKRISRAPVKFADLVDGNDACFETESEDDAPDLVEKNDMSCAAELQTLYANGNLPFRAQLQPRDEEFATLMRQACPKQPHPKLFAWAMRAKVNTNKHGLTYFILLAEGRRHIRSRKRGVRVATSGKKKFKIVGGESTTEYIFFLNEQLELLIETSEVVRTGVVATTPVALPPAQSAYDED